MKEIKKRLDEAWKLNEKEGFGQPQALKDIKTLLNILSNNDDIKLKCLKCGNNEMSMFETSMPRASCTKHS